VAYFRKALADNDRQFSPAWTNLGTLYLRLGHLAHAEAAYLQALKADRDELVAMSNLARLYERQGDSRRAAAYRKRVVHHRMQNPYYRFQRAREAYGAGDWDAAIGHLKFAVRKSPARPFSTLMARCYLGRGRAGRPPLAGQGGGWPRPMPQAQARPHARHPGDGRPVAGASALDARYTGVTTRPAGAGASSRVGSCAGQAAPGCRGKRPEAARCRESSARSCGSSS
jgi:tetratricopeptide (TPR) repeat protein